MVEKLKNMIIEANAAYRSGEPIMSDQDYDQLLDQLAILSPDDELLTKVGVEVDETRKVKLPIEMASMNKIKTIEEIDSWIKTRGINPDNMVVITPKYDGISLACDEKTKQGFTRGDGVFGQNSDQHIKLINNMLDDTDRLDFTYGEAIMKKSVFLKKYFPKSPNPRNLVAGLFNSKTATEQLKDCDFIKFGAVHNDQFTRKSELLDYLNSKQEVKVPYTLSKISELSEDMLIKLFHKYSEDYTIDGLIIELDDLSMQKSLGREKTSNNPVWARAFKHNSFEEKAQTVVLGITWNISKQGLLKPVINIEPVNLDGAMVSNITGNNARFIKDMGIGVGSIIVVKRSGMVIPIVVEVKTTVDFVLPEIGSEIGWNENGIELITLTETDDQKIKKNIAFFEILEADNVSEGIIKQLWDAGFKTIKDILSLTKDDLEKLDGFGKRKAKIVFDSLRKSTTDVQLSKLQHATGLFPMLGSKKLVLLEHFTEKPTVEMVSKLDGFAEKSSMSYVDNYDSFYEFIKDLPITIQRNVEVVLESTDLLNKTFVFTGVRRKDLEEVILSKGGKIGSGVSKNSSYLVCKDVDASSSKLVKARELGVGVIDVAELESMLK